MSPSSRPPLLLTICTALLLSGCAVGPDYRAPALPVASRPLGLEGNTSTAATAATSAGAPSPWWKAGDPALASLVERALEGNRDLRAASANLNEARALRKEARSAFFPVGYVGAGYRRQLDSTVFFKGVPRDQRDQNIFDVGLDSAWELDLFGRVRRSVEARTALTGAAEADLAQLRLLVAIDTAQAYVDLATIQVALSLQQSVVQNQQEIIRLLRLQVEAGKLSRDKVGPVEIDLANIRAQLRDFELTERALRNRLGVLLGGATPIPNFAARLPELPAPAFKGDLASLLARRPDLRAAEQRLVASNAAIGLTKADYFPTLSLSARLGAEATNLGNLNSSDANVFSFGPRLQWDLLNLQRTRARVKAAEARKDQAFAAWEGSVLLAVEEIDNALARRNEALARVEDWKRATEASDEALRIALRRQGEGLLDPVNFLAAEQAALQARLQTLRSKAELASATLFLHKALAAD